MKITISQEGYNPITISTESSEPNMKNEIAKKADELMKYIKSDDNKINKYIHDKNNSIKIISETLNIMYNNLKNDYYYEFFLEDNNINSIKDFYKMNKKDAYNLVLNSIDFNTKNNQITKPDEYWTKNIRLKYKTIDGHDIPICWFAIPFGWSGDAEHGRGIRIDMQGSVIDYGDQAEMCWY